MRPNTLLAFMGGAIAGAVVALLFAPEKGETIRKAIKDKAVDGYNAAKEKVADGYNAAKEKATDGYNAAKEKVSQQRSKVEAAVKE